MPLSVFLNSHSGFSRISVLAADGCCSCDPSLDGRTSAAAPTRGTPVFERLPIGNSEAFRGPREGSHSFHCCLPFCDNVVNETLVVSMLAISDLLTYCSVMRGGVLTDMPPSQLPVGLTGGMW